MNGRKIYIDSSGTISRIAMTENDELAEFMVETPDDERLVGNVYRGRVKNVLQGMQAAFVDIGRERNAFLFVSDMPVDRRDIESDIHMQDTLSVTVGQDILCQVIKDEGGTKGARVTTNISLVGRYVVATPTLGFYGVSRKIEDEDKRAQLYKNLKDVLPEGWGGIARTQSANVSKREVNHEIGVLKHIYADMLQAYVHAGVGELIYSDSDILMNVGRDIVDERVESLTVNQTELAERFRKYLALVGNNKTKVIAYPAASDMFGEFDLTRKVNRLLSNRVNLKCGGSLTIDKTEALTVVDVNSSKFVGTTFLEDTVYKVNLEAAQEIARQLRLRNIGGIIIVDFIDMELEEHRQSVQQVLEDALKEDRVKCRVIGMTSLGLVQITRKKMRNDISCYLQEPCPHCAGTGKVIAAATVVPKAAKLINKAFLDPAATGVLVRVHPSLADAMQRGALTVECETMWKDKRVYVVAEETRAREEIELDVMRGAAFGVPDNAKLLY